MHQSKGVGRGNSEGHCFQAMSVFQDSSSLKLDPSKQIPESLCCSFQEKDHYSAEIQDFIQASWTFPGLSLSPIAQSQERVCQESTKKFRFLDCNPAYTFLRVSSTYNNGTYFWVNVPWLDLLSHCNIPFIPVSNLSRENSSFHIGVIVNINKDLQRKWDFSSPPFPKRVTFIDSIKACELKLHPRPMITMYCFCSFSLLKPSFCFWLLLQSIMFY